MANTCPTIFHITHWKAGSQWVAEILKHSAPERFVPWQLIDDPSALGGAGMPIFYVKPISPGKLYGTVYLRRNRFYEILNGRYWKEGQWSLFYPRRIINNWWNYRIRHSPVRLFVINRDLRDTLVSLYFSTKKSHKVIVDQLSNIRKTLDGLDEEDGLLYIMRDVLPGSARIQKSWINAPEVLPLKYEDILDNEYEFFEELIDYCEINISREKLHNIVRYNIFEVATGRKRGQEDANAHLRKGIAGDWRNYFTEKIKKEFKKKYGQLLIDTGYEKNMEW